jgi:hypothetical protein
MANAKSKALFVPANLEDFLPGASVIDGMWRSNPRQTYRIIGEADVVMDTAEGWRHVFVIQLSTIRSLRYSVVVSEVIPQEGDSITFMERTSRDDVRIRINIDKKNIVREVPLLIDLPNGEMLVWKKSVMFKKVGGAWLLIEVDGRKVQFEQVLH